MNAGLDGLLPAATGSRHENVTALTGIGDGDGGATRADDAVDGVPTTVGVTGAEEAIRALFGEGCGDDPQATARNTRLIANAVLTVTCIQRRPVLIRYARSLLRADEQVGPGSPFVEEAVHVSFRKPVALRGSRC